MLIRQNILVTLHIVLFATFMSSSVEVSSQDKIELGVMLGGAYYMGDLNPSQHFLKPRPAIGFLGRYAFTDRLAAKLNITAAWLAGEYPSGGNIYKNGGDYEFDRGIVDVGFTGEFNFMSYDHMFFKDKSKFTPYLTVGVAATCYKSYKEDSDGKERIVLSLPFGIGAKYKINQWLRLGMEWTMRKTFCDDLDMVGDVSGRVNGSDPYGFDEKVLTHNNDWYSIVGVTATISMWPRKLECNDGTRNFNK